MHRFCDGDCFFPLAKELEDFLDEGAEGGWRKFAHDDTVTS